VLSFQLHVLSVFPDGSFLSILVPGVVLGLPLSAAFSQVLLKSIDGVYASEFIDVVRGRVLQGAVSQQDVSLVQGIMAAKARSRLRRTRAAC
jgi:hypothetical protein